MSRKRLARNGRSFLGGSQPAGTSMAGKFGQRAHGRSSAPRPRFRGCGLGVLLAVDFTASWRVWGGRGTRPPAGSGAHRSGRHRRGRAGSAGRWLRGRSASGKFNLSEGSSMNLTAISPSRRWRDPAHRAAASWSATMNSGGNDFRQRAAEGHVRRGRHRYLPSTEPDRSATAACAWWSGWAAKGPTRDS